MDVLGFGAEHLGEVEHCRIEQVNEALAHRIGGVFSVTPARLRTQLALHRFGPPDRVRSCISPIGGAKPEYAAMPTRAPIMERPATPTSNPSNVSPDHGNQIERRERGVDTTLDVGDEPALSPLHHLVLRTDGTLSDLIAALVGEPLGMTRIAHRSVTVSTAVAVLGIDAGEPLIERQVSLHGRDSGSIYLRADVLIAGNRVPPPLRQALERTDTPFGHLCRQHRLEMFREAPTIGHARSSTTARLLARRYRMIVGGRPMAIIREVFTPALWARASVWSGGLPPPVAGKA